MKELGLRVAKLMAEPRQILDSDELMEMTDVMPHYEFGCNRCHLHVFTVNGLLKGNRVHGALFAAECMVVQAKTMDQARELAADGLLSTRNLLVEEYYTQGIRSMAGANDALAIETAGRKAGPAPVLKDQKLIHMLENYIGKKH